MSSGLLLVLIGLGAAANAIWFYVRFPSLAPRELKYGIVHLAASSLLAQLGVPLALDASGDSKPLALLAIFGVAFPILAYVLLSGFWLLKLAQGMLAGSLR